MEKYNKTFDNINLFNNKDIFNSIIKYKIYQKWKCYWYYDRSYTEKK